MRIIVMAAWMLMGVAASGCEKSPPPTEKAAATLPAGMLVDRDPGTPMEVADAKKTAKLGDELVVRGRIGGSAEPFVKDRAIFTLADFRIPPCNANPEDNCETPWDYCCEPPDKLAANTLTIELVGDDHKPLKSNIQGAGGLSPLAEIVAKGRVCRKDNNVLVLDVSAIHVRNRK